MLLSVVRFCSLFFTAVALAPALAHALELPHKIGFSREEYLVVQQIYRGWSLLGIVVLLALASNATLTVLLARAREKFGWALTATLAIAGTQVLFWLFTFPANRETNNWTTLPPHWPQLRAQWEYSHAGSAVLNLMALAALILALMPRRGKP
jgi:hypothetical protein